MARPTDPVVRELLREIDTLRGAVRFAEDTLRKLNHCQHVDVPVVIRKLAAIRAESRRTVALARSPRSAKV